LGFAIGKAETMVYVIQGHPYQEPGYKYPNRLEAFIMK